MAQWGMTDNAANSVTWAPGLVNKTANSSNQTNLYGNTTTGAFVSNIRVSQEGVVAADIANTQLADHNAQHAGWNLKKVGTGSLLSITISAGGSSYANTDLVKVSVTGTGTVNATGTVTTNATGGITAISISNVGSGFVSVNPTVTITNATGGTTSGSSANLIATVGGRAGRINYETLIAAGSLS